MLDYARQIGHFSRNVHLLLTANLLFNAGVGFFAVLFNLYLTAVGKDLQFLGTMSAANTLAVAAGSLTTRPLLRRYDARLVMAAGATIFGVVTLAETYLTNSAVLLVLTALAGAGVGIVSAPPSPYLAEHTTPSERSRAFSVFFASSTAGVTLGSFGSGAVSLLVAGRLPGFEATSVSTYRLSLTLACLLILAAAIPFARLAPGLLGARIDRVPNIPVPARARPARDMAAMLIAIGVLAIAFGMTAPYYNLYFADVTHATPSQIGFIFSLTSILTTVATLTSPTLGQGLGRLLAFNLSRVGAAGCLLLLALHGGLVVAAIIYIVLNMLLNIAGAIDYNFVMEMLPATMRSTAASFRVAIFNAGWAITAFFSGSLIQKYGYTPALLVATVGTALCAVIYFGYFHLTGYREVRGWFMVSLPIGPHRTRKHPTRSR